MKRGFTLIELLVVVLIIGILAAIALPQYQKAVGKARFAAIKPVTESLRLAAQVYYLANASYPTTSEEQETLDIPIPSSVNCHITTVYTMCSTNVGGYRMQYQVPHDTSNRSRLCVVFSTVSLVNDICRQETGFIIADIEQRFSDNDGYISYAYQ